MANKKYTWKKIHEVRDLYREGELTMKEISEKTDVPLSTIQNWKSKYGWVSRNRSN